MKTTSGWSAKLTRWIVLKDGTRLVTLGDVRAFILKQTRAYPGARFLAACRGVDDPRRRARRKMEAATTQIEDALFLEARYVRQWH